MQPRQKAYLVLLEGGPVGIMWRYQIELDGFLQWDVAPCVIVEDSQEFDVQDRVTLVFAHDEVIGIERTAWKRTPWTERESRLYPPKTMTFAAGTSTTGTVIGKQLIANGRLSHTLNLTR